MSPASPHRPLQRVGGTLGQDPFHTDGLIASHPSGPIDARSTVERVGAIAAIEQIAAGTAQQMVASGSGRRACRLRRGRG